MRVLPCAATALAILGFLGFSSNGAKAGIVITSELTLDGCTGGCANPAADFGTVKITQSGAGANIVFDVTLKSGYSFQGNGQGHNAFMFNPDFAFTYLNTVANPLQSGFTPVASLPAGNAPFGTFQQGLDYSGPSTLQTLEFTLTGVTVDLSKSDFALSVDPPGSKVAYFSADISSTNGNTGVVGGANISSVNLTTSVPEPSTWAMMMLGFFGVGFIAYRKRERTLRFA